MVQLCDICGKAINPERLAILPNTRRCVDCAREKGSDVIVPRTVDMGFDADTYRDLLDAIRD